jgi:hypothetical protein
MDNVPNRADELAAPITADQLVDEALEAAEADLAAGRTARIRPARRRLPAGRARRCDAHHGDTDGEAHGHDPGRPWTRQRRSSVGRPGSSPVMPKRS